METPADSESKDGVGGKTDEVGKGGPSANP
jgi:hypothetical protein